MADDEKDPATEGEEPTTPETPAEKDAAADTEGAGGEG